MSSRADRGVVRKGVTTVLVRPTPRGRVLLVGLVAATAVGLAGCNSTADETPSPTEVPRSSEPSSPSSPSPSASPSPTETSSIPAAAREQTPEGAEAFVRYFMARVNEAWTTPATGIIAADSTPDCKFCLTAEETAKWLVEHGHRYERDPVTVVDIAPLSGAPNDQIYLTAVMVQNSSDIVDTRGAVQSSESEKRLDRTIALKWADDRWSMFALERS